MAFREEVYGVDITINERHRQGQHSGSLFEFKMKLSSKQKKFRRSVGISDIYRWNELGLVIAHEEYGGLGGCG
jgi:hypothetical protein